MTLTTIFLKVLGIDPSEMERLKKELAAANARTNVSILVPQDIIDEPKYTIDQFPYPLAIRTYQFKDRWEYEILENDAVVIHQDFEPGVNGFIPMTQEKAEEYAKAALQNRIDMYSEMEAARDGELNDGN